MSEKFTVDYFIEKFSAIPEEKWCVGNYEDKDGRRCAYGHLRVGFDAPTKASNALAVLFNKHLGLFGGYINDGKLKEYPQPTPRARILAALHDIKAKQLTESEAIAKSTEGKGVKV